MYYLRIYFYSIADKPFNSIIPRGKKIKAFIEVGRMLKSL